MNEVPFGFLIVIYLFLGGMSAGLFFVSALGTLLLHRGDPACERIARVGGLLAPWPVALGSGVLIFDLGQMHKFYELFLLIRLDSPMSMGSWLLILFVAVSMVYFWVWLPNPTIERVWARLPERLQNLRLASRLIQLLLWNGRSKLAFPLALVGAPTAIGVGVYTGVLLGVIQGRPFWNISLLAQMFLFSALSSGCALLVLALALQRRAFSEREARFLYGVDIAFIMLELFIVVPYVLHGALFPLAARGSLSPILGGPFTIPFWVLFLTVGMLTPLAIELYEIKPGAYERPKFHSNRLLAGVAASLILFGGFMLRYVFVYGGQGAAYF
jgi:formate-dependent nitrite reductase membrane component NrfD